MQIQTNLPVAFSCLGERAVNQDALYPQENTAGENTQLFVVCDGMGGADKGEVASQLLCQGIAAYVSATENLMLDGETLQEAINQVYQSYFDYLQQNPFVNRMGSTLALLQFHEHGATVAHVGDSRIYQLRAGQIIFRTKDHKQVNDMVEAGIITAVQARTHPWRHRLSRAVVARAGDSPTSSAQSVPEIKLLTDIQPGDSFFLCTDGVLEQVDDNLLESMVAEHPSDQAKVASLMALCHGKTQDNYSGYWISVRNVTQKAPVPQPHLHS
ncbi:Stp1/IreP family PP2C-type Ser/Thr phosphatase [Larkinella harenae]